MLRAGLARARAREGDDDAERQDSQGEARDVLPAQGPGWNWGLQHTRGGGDAGEDPAVRAADGRVLKVGLREVVRSASGPVHKGEPRLPRWSRGLPVEWAQEHRPVHDRERAEDQHEDPRRRRADAHAAATWQEDQQRRQQQHRKELERSPQADGHAGQQQLAAEHGQHRRDGERDWQQVGDVDGRRAVVDDGERQAECQCGDGGGGAPERLRSRRDEPDAGDSRSNQKEQLETQPEKRVRGPHVRACQRAKAACQGLQADDERLGALRVRGPDVPDSPRVGQRRDLGEPLEVAEFPARKRVQHEMVVDDPQTGEDAEDNDDEPNGNEDVSCRRRKPGARPHVEQPYRGHRRGDDQDEANAAGRVVCRLRLARRSDRGGDDGERREYGQRHQRTPASPRRAEPRGRGVAALRVNDRRECGGHR